MKRGIIVLLIAVLVAGFAFAGFDYSGNVKFTLGADFEKKTFGFGNFATGYCEFKFTYDTLSVNQDAQETDLWAEIAATANVKLDTVAALDTDTPVDESRKISVTADGSFAAIIEIITANIHVGEWTFGIKNVGSAVNYAKSYYDIDDDGNKNDVVKGEARIVPGFTVSYKGWSSGFGFRGNWAGEKLAYNVFAYGETKTFKFGENEEFSLQAGAYVHYYNKEKTGAYPKNFGAAAKLAYAADAFSADASADLQLVRVESENTFYFEADANATYKINDNGSVGLNVYGTNLIAIYTGQEKPYAGVDSASKYAEEKGIKLDAKLWAKYDFDFESVKLSTEGSVEIRDALVEDRDLVVSAKVTFSVGKFDIWAKANKIQFSFADGNISLSAIKLSCGIKSTKIIKNAEIGLEYKNLDLAKNENSITNKGAIEAYTKIAF